jgi:hypothetical protein
MSGQDGEPRKPRSNPVFKTHGNSNRSTNPLENSPKPSTSREHESPPYSPQSEQCSSSSECSDEEKKICKYCMLLDYKDPDGNVVKHWYKHCKHIGEYMDTYGESFRTTGIRRPNARYRNYWRPKRKAELKKQRESCPGRRRRRKA